MSKHETIIQYAKTVLLAAILGLAVWGMGVHQVSASPPQAGGPTGQPVPAFAQLLGGTDGTNLRGISTDTSGRIIIGNTPGTSDPCQSEGTLKSSAVINVTSAATTSLVAVSGTKAVYVCGITITIAPSATSADTATFEYGTGAACTGPTVLTGSFGAGDLTTAAPPLFITLADPGTSMTAPSSNGVCILSAGTTVNIQGIIQYVQQ